MFVNIKITFGENNPVKVISYIKNKIEYQVFEIYMITIKISDLDIIKQTYTISSIDILNNALCIINS